MGEANPAWVPGRDEAGAIEMSQRGQELLARAFAAYARGRPDDAGRRLAETMLICPPAFNELAESLLATDAPSAVQNPAWPGFAAVLRAVIALNGALQWVTVEAPSPPPAPDLPTHEEFLARLDAMISEGKAMQAARRKLGGGPR